MKFDRRAHKRFSHEAPITQENLGSEIYYTSKMYNYSKDGLYFETDTDLKAGEEIFIGIENSPYVSESGIYECYFATIVWRKELKNSTYNYAYGVKLNDPDKHAVKTKLNIISDERVAPTNTLKVSKDLRKHPRRRYNKSINYFAQNQLMEGIIKNICRSGAFIETRHNFKPGQKLTLVLPFINKDQGAMIKGEVIWTNRQGIGVKFKKLKKQ
jgi:Tfp pilus assembly protein PilZ